MASASSAIEVPVFIDTSLGTHIAISVSPYLTVAEFKNSLGAVWLFIYLLLFEIIRLDKQYRAFLKQLIVASNRNKQKSRSKKFETLHLHCYPGIGNIKVDALKVKRKSCLYHLPESMPIKHAFQGSKKTWFLYTEAYALNKKMPSTLRSEVVHGSLSESRTENNCGKSRKKTRGKDFHSSLLEPTSDRMSESISVSGIINKYFYVYDDEVTSSNSKPRVPKYAPITPPARTNDGGLRDKKKSNGVGKRLVVTANNLGISTSDKKPMISLCKYKCDQLLEPESSSLVRHPIFEFGKNDYL